MEEKAYSIATIAQSIDHTLLKPTATKEQIITLCEEAKSYDFYSVCINPKWLSTCVEILRHSQTKPITVVGFPLGATTTEEKIYETHFAVADGAEEIDMVIDVSLAISGKWQELTEEINSIVRAAKGKPVKVILETAYLNESQIYEASKCAIKAEAAFVKTSTGFASRGASLNDIAVMKDACEGSATQIKASGGIKTLEDWTAFFKAGASRIGTSSGVAIINEAQTHASL